ncbi:hypothetical protein DSUL_50116 [Desulfovibrionales bacterium]
MSYYPTRDTSHLTTLYATSTLTNSYIDIQNIAKTPMFLKLYYDVTVH